MFFLEIFEPFILVPKFPAFLVQTKAPLDSSSKARARALGTNSIVDRLQFQTVRSVVELDSIEISPYPQLLRPLKDLNGVLTRLPTLLHEIFATR